MLKIRAISFSLSSRPSSKEEWSSELYRDIDEAVKANADVIVFPEYCLLGLAPFFRGEFRDQLPEVWEYLKTRVFPTIETMVKGRDILLCLGSGPRIDNGTIRNSSPIYTGSRWFFQDKIHLTPWETDFTPGRDLQIFTYRNLKAAVLICYDIEQPSLASQLKHEGIDFLLVPSATADKNGSQRVLRCASARSIELGAAVLPVPLIGRSLCDLVDVSEGRSALFLPSQAVVTVAQEEFSAYSGDEAIIKDYTLSTELMKALKIRDEETKPYFKIESEVSLVKHRN